MTNDFYRQRDEAIAAGDRALSSLKQALNQLQSAGHWGIFDMLGGGTLASLVKHAKLDRSRQAMEQAKYDLQRFGNELEDVQSVQSLSIDIGDFLTFADFLFDGFLVDWMVQSRIREAQRNIEDAIHRVERLLRELRSL